jgi:predicted ATPase/DNA-binding SARP family transcriptional activator
MAVYNEPDGTVSGQYPFLGRNSMLRIHLLGRFLVDRDGAPIPDSEWARRKTRALLKLLCLRPDHRLHREQAMDLLWPDLDPVAARDNFYRNLSFLRHTLEPDIDRPAASRYVTFADEVLVLGPAGDLWIDVEVFEQLLARARGASGASRLALLGDALALYRGDLLPEDAYEEWAIPRRDALRRAARDALLQLASANRQRDAYDEALTALQRLLQIDPLDEHGHRELMLVYALAGRRNEALRQYSRLAGALSSELGVAPEPETTRLYERVRSGEITSKPGAEPSTQAPPSDSPPPSIPDPQLELPEHPTTFVGREREVAEACRLLRRSGIRLLTFTGPAGIGKTRLATQVAKTIAADYPDGAFFVPLAPIRDRELVLSALARALFLREAGGRALLDVLRTHLRGKRLLLLLDNFEQVMPAAPYLSELLAGAPGVQMIVTSRELLRLSAEHDFPVPPLALPGVEHARAAPSQSPSQPPEALSGYPAVALFVARARAVRPGFALTPENAEEVVEICRRLDGIPLAIELAAARTRLLAPRALLARLSSRMRTLSEGPRDLPARQQTLYDAIRWSYELLTPPEQALFAQLAVFAGGWTEEAAAAITEAPGPQGAAEIRSADLEAGAQTDPRRPPESPRWGLLDGLSSLVDKSLLGRSDAGDGEPRFNMLETMREYAWERLEAGLGAAEGGPEAAQRRHAHYFLSLAEAGAADWFTGRQRYWLTRFDEELHNFRAALSWSLSAEPDLALRLGGALWRYWLAHAYLSEGRRWLEDALAQLPRQQDGKAAPDRAARARALFGAGVLANHQADYRRAAEVLAQSLGIARALGADEQIANSLVGLGVTAHYTGQYEQAIAALEQALPIFRRLGHRRGAALALNSLSNAVLCLGDPPRAASLACESLQLGRTTDDTLTVAASLANLGRATMEQGNLAEARPHLNESLALRRTLGDMGGIAHTLSFLGALELRERNTTAAAALFAESLRLRHEIGDSEGMAAPLEGLAAVAGAQGAWARAARLYGAADSLRRAIGAPLPPHERSIAERVLGEARCTIGGAAWDAEYEIGRTMPIDEAVVQPSLAGGGGAD